MELQALTKGELLGYPLDAIPPSRDSSLETLVLPPSPRDNDNDDDEVRAHARARAHLGSANGRTYSLTRAGPQVHEAVLGELLDSQADWPSHPRCTARPPHAHRTPTASHVHAHVHVHVHVHAACAYGMYTACVL